MTDLPLLLEDPAMPIGEPFAHENLVANGWVYRDMKGWITDAQGRELVRVVGEENMRWLIFTRRESDLACRGQLMVSPEGMKRYEAAKA